MHVTTDRAEVVRWLERRLAVDPVRATVIGTLVAEAREGSGEPWCAVSCVDVHSTDDPGVAARLQRRFPANLDGPWRAADLPDLVDTLGTLPQLRGVSGERDLVTEVVRLLGRPERERMAMRLHRLDALAHLQGVPGSGRRAGPPDRELMLQWLTAFSREVFGDDKDVTDLVEQMLASRGAWLWVDPSGEPVSMASRRSVVAGVARVGPVYTPPASRARGYAAAVTTAATADVLADHGIPVLFTDATNPTSNALYARLGYRPVQDRLQVMFAEA